MPLAGLPVGHMQFIEIAREVDKKQVKLLIFDEPTAVLTETEAARLLEVMRSLAAEGLGILFITHRLDEVMSVADEITVLRDGEVAARLDPKHTTVVAIAEKMVGRPAAVIRHADRPSWNCAISRSRCRASASRVSPWRSSAAKCWVWPGSPGTARWGSRTG
jgi:simple sugar transport system ATP-binding protein